MGQLFQLELLQDGTGARLVISTQADRQERLKAEATLKCFALNRRLDLNHAIQNILNEFCQAFGPEGDEAAQSVFRRKASPYCPMGFYYEALLKRFGKQLPTEAEVLEWHLEDLKIRAEYVRHLLAREPGDPGLEKLYERWVFALSVLDTVNA